MKAQLKTAVLLLTVICMDLLAGAEFDLFVSSFPELQREFNLTPFWVEAMLSVNFAGYCLSLFFVGGLADRYGRKPIIVSGLLIFTLGSVLCLWASWYPLLLIGRFLQGIGVAAPAILSFLIIADAYPIKQQQYLLAMLNGLMNASVAASPVVGSYITLYFHWQGNFIALLVLGLFTLMMTLCFLPPSTLPTNKEPISLRGYFPIFQSKTVMLLIVHIVLACVPYWVFVGMSPILYMEDLGVSLSHFGYYQGLMALVFAVGSVVYGWMISKREYDQKKMLRLACVIGGIGIATAAWATWTNSASPLWLVLALLPFIISQIIPSTILYPACLNLMPEAKGRVTAVLQGMRLILTAICLQIAGYFYAGSFQQIGLIIVVFMVGALWTLCIIVKRGYASPS